MSKLIRFNLKNEEGQNMEKITGLDQNAINKDEGNDQNVNKHTNQTNEPDNISINEAQTEFEKLFSKEMIKLNAIVQKHIIGMDIVISEELFDEFKKASSIAEKKYITFREMMAYAMDASNRECLTKTNANNLNINDYLKHIMSLKKKLNQMRLKWKLKKHR
ncbi:hypothetical protein EV1_003355 [Malus domestica]